MLHQFGRSWVRSVKSCVGSLILMHFDASRAAVERTRAATDSVPDESKNPRRREYALPRRETGNFTSISLNTGWLRSFIFDSSA
jgi:hypothetical protein